MGWPLSTTHVSCGALFAIGARDAPGEVENHPGIFAAWLIACSQRCWVHPSCG